MQPVVADGVTRSVDLLSVGLSLCPSVTTVSPAKAAEPIVMPFGMWTNCVLDGGSDPRTQLNSTQRVVTDAGVNTSLSVSL